MSTINKVAVIGGGIGGMFTALTLAKRGCEVTVLEHDDVPMPPTVDAAWESWERRRSLGSPTSFPGGSATWVRHNHPSVYEQLLAAGATETSVMDSPAPGRGISIRTRR